MIAQALLFLISTLGDFFAGVLLLRFLLQWLRAPAGNPLSPFVIALTNFIVKPARRIIPGLWGMDLSTLVLSWLVATLMTGLTLKISGYTTSPHIGEVAIGICALGALRVLRIAISLAVIALLLQVVLSWVSPDSPFAPTLNNLTRPLLRPLQQRIPPVANIDLTPWIAFVILQLILIVPVSWLEMLVGRLLMP